MRRSLKSGCFEGTSKGTVPVKIAIHVFSYCLVTLPSRQFSRHNSNLYVT